MKLGSKKNSKPTKAELEMQAERKRQEAKAKAKIEAKLADKTSLKDNFRRYRDTLLNAISDLFSQARQTMTQYFSGWHVRPKAPPS